MANESLSALLDGECSAGEMDRLLDELERSPELKQQYSRQCLAREARNGTRVRKQQPCICAGVMSALDDAPEALNLKVVDLASRRKAPAWKPLAGLALAASFGAVAVLVTQPAREPVAVESAASTAAPQTSVPVSLPATRARTRALQSVALRPDEIEQQDELNSLLMEHNGSMSGQGMGGTLRYARFAAHTAEYRPSASAGDQP